VIEFVTFYSFFSGTQNINVMLRFSIPALLFVFMFSCSSSNQETPGNAWDTTFSFDWKFAKGDNPDAVNVDFDDTTWENVNLPHDWAISGPFGELTESGNTGKLPWKGEGWYRKSFNLAEKDLGKQLQFLFDGVMANPKVYLNGAEVGSWRYGYNSFWIDATQAAQFGATNVLTIHADTREHASRWYPGGGIYRKVSMRLVEPVYIPVWGIYITTPEVSTTRASMHVEVDLVNNLDESRQLRLEWMLMDPSDSEVGKGEQLVEVKENGTEKAVVDMAINNPEIWDIDDPNLYTCITKLYDGNREIQREQTRMGFRTFEWTANDGFHLNGRRVQLQGVNLHHDQGALGAAFLPRAMERQLEIMQEMGVNAIRTSHNACAPEVLSLCDQMGIIVYNELFDKYGPTAGVACSTGEFVDNYAEAEVKNFVLRDRNHPSVFLWSIGNEIPDLLTDSDGRAAEHVANMVKYFKQYDTTRPTTMGCHIPSASEGDKHILDALETSGWNYGRRYVTTRKAYPNMPLTYSESASAFGTRGAYKLEFPKNKMDYGTDGEITSYMLTAAPWSDIPEVEFEYMRIDDFIAGEFVWTGFDYLGEPSPFVPGRWGVQTPEGHVARSSYFGIVDLAGLPKDSYYNYRSLWKNDDHTIHLTPHWNWEGHEGQNIPVMLYTDGDEAELFLNGKSMGRRKKLHPDQVKMAKSMRDNFEYSVGEFDYNKGIMEDKNPYYEIIDAYRLRWMEVPYEVGEIKAVVYKGGEKIGETTVKTAGTPAGLQLTPDRTTMNADGMDLCYVTIEMTDENGILCPLAMDKLTFKVEGAANFMGVANGDAMGHDAFTDDTHTLFYGKAVAVLRSAPGQSGEARLIVSTADGHSFGTTVLFQN
jgi:beta-galactosidase